MTEFILGFPKGKENIRENIEMYSKIQDATSVTNYVVGVYANNLEEDKEKLIFLCNHESENLNKDKQPKHNPLVRTIMTTIKDFQIEANKIAEEKGFWDYYNIFNPIKEGNEETAKWIREQHICTKIALVITELSEAIETRRKDKFANLDKYSDGLGMYNEKDLSPADKTTVANTEFELHIKDTYEDELADACIRLFDLAEKTGVDLTWHIQQKMIYNSTRDKMHGKKY